MEYDKKDWKRSDGRYQSFGKESKEKEKALTAYHPADRENTKERRQQEMMTMESSYGGISFGANRRQEMMMVVHEKRRSHGKGLKNDDRRLDARHTVSLSELRGDFRTNSHNPVESAVVYQENAKTSPLKMMARLQEMMDENENVSGEKVLPFLNRKQDEKEKRQIQKNLRDSLEKGNRTEHLLWERQQETFLQERSEKEQMYRHFYQELQFAKEKSQKMMKKDDGFLQNLIHTALQETQNDTTEDDTDDTFGEDATKNVVKKSEN